MNVIRSVRAERRELLLDLRRVPVARDAVGVDVLIDGDEVGRVGGRAPGARDAGLRVDHDVRDHARRARAARARGSRRSGSSRGWRRSPASLICVAVAAPAGRTPPRGSSSGAGCSRYHSPYTARVAQPEVGAQVDDSHAAVRAAPTRARRRRRAGTRRSRRRRRHGGRGRAPRARAAPGGAGTARRAAGPTSRARGDPRAARTTDGGTAAAPSARPCTRRRRRPTTLGITDPPGRARSPAPRDRAAALGDLLVGQRPVGRPVGQPQRQRHVAGADPLGVAVHVEHLGAARAAARRRARTTASTSAALTSSATITARSSRTAGKLVRSS